MVLTVGVSTVDAAVGGPSLESSSLPGGPVGGVGAAVGTVGAVWALAKGTVHSRMAKKRLSSRWKTGRDQYAGLRLDNPYVFVIRLRVVQSLI